MKAVVLGLVIYFNISLLKAVEFPAVMRDPNTRLLWSRALEGLYTNGCVGLSYDQKCETERGYPVLVKLNSSEAVKACQRIGGRLPTPWEYQQLVMNFDHWDRYPGISLTSKGIEQMNQVFGDLGNTQAVKFTKSFWTSHAGGDEATHQRAVVFQVSKYDDVGLIMGIETLVPRVSGHAASPEGNRNSALLVRCVSSD